VRLWRVAGKSNTQTITVTTAGTYSVTVVDGNGCNSSDTVIVVENPNPTPAITGNTSFCTGDSITLNAGNYNTYLWTPSGNTQTISVTSGGTYSVTVTDGNACIGVDSIIIIENASPIVTVTDDSVCIGYQASLIASGASTYVWSNSSTSNSLLASPSSTTTYTVTGTDLNSCTGSATGTITVHQGPQAIYFVNPDKAEVGEIVYFTDASIGANSWYWNFGDGQTASGLDPTHSYQLPGVYTSWLIVEDDYGCRDSSSVNLNIVQLFTFYIPNAFSPNDDGINDVFIPKGINIDEDRYTMQIFDRWGMKVFETSDLYEAWDGKVNGQVIDNDNMVSAIFVYYVHLYEKYTDIDHEYRGKILMLK